MALIENCFGCSNVVCFILICEEAINYCPCRICIIKPVCKITCDEFDIFSNRIKYEKGKTWYDENRSSENCI